MSIKKCFLTLLALVVIFILAISIRTLSYTFGEISPVDKNTQPVINNSAPSEIAIRRFAGGLRIATISSTNYHTTNFGPFNEFTAYLAQAYPRVYAAMETTKINDYGLVFHWKGKDPSRKPLLFLSHYDVVPVQDYSHDDYTASELIYHLDEDDVQHQPVDKLQTHWEHPPFSGAVANGRIYGRGALDMKGMLFALMEAADALIEEGFQPRQDIWLAFGHDEEVGGLHGATQIAAYFRQQGITFDAVYDEGGIVAAPASIMKKIQKPVALVGVAEKGFLTLNIKVRGVGGHSSMPPKKSALVQAAEIIEKLNKNQMPARLIPPVASFLDTVGGEMGLLPRIAIANRWVLKPVLLYTLGQSHSSNALIRTTTAVTMAKGSDAPNVVASTADITVNFRLLPGNNVNDVIAHVKQLCQDYDIEIETVNAREPSALSPEDSPHFIAIKKAIARLYPDAIVSSYITIGGTDAYKYQGVSDNIYRFMPVLLNQYEQQSIHSENESITLDNYGRMIAYFTLMMKGI